MGTVKDFINRVKQREGLKFDGQVAELLGIDRRILANWKSRESLPTSYQKWYCDRYDIEIKDFHKEIKLTNKDIQLEGDNSMDARYVIDLQKEKIERQTIEIESLKSALEDKQAESTHWDALSYDYITHVTLIRSGINFGRRFDNVSDLEKQSSILGYSIKELEKLWDVGTKYDRIHDHPIDSIFCKETILMVEEQTKTLPVLFDAMKSIVGNHYIPHPLIYKHKDGQKIGAISYCKVEWRKMKIIAKVQFIID